MKFIIELILWLVIGLGVGMTLVFVGTGALEKRKDPCTLMFLIAIGIVFLLILSDLFPGLLR